MADNQISMNPWKLSTIALAVVGVTVAVTTFVTGQKSDVVTGPSAKAASANTAQHKASQAATHAQPSQAVVEACNRHANEQVTGKTTEVVKDAGIGAVIGAAVGAVGGAIADGGKGAGKGAAIGGIVGATGGSLYGVNENKTNDDRYKAAYASCMHAKGYPA